MDRCVLSIGDGTSVSIDSLEPMDPVLDVTEGSLAFSKFMIRQGHFTFHVNPDPSAQEWRPAGVAFVRKAITSSTRSGSFLVYAISNGQAKEIAPKESEAYVDLHLEYVRTYTVSSFSKDVGIQKWGVVRIAREPKEILSEWPGPIAKEIVLPCGVDSLSVETRHRLSDWYSWESVDDTLLVERS